MSARILNSATGPSAGTTSTHDGGDEDWRHQAACLDYDPDLWHAADHERNDTRPDRVTEAQSICAACPVKTTCYTDAIETLEQYAVRGGVDFSTLPLRTVYHWREALRKTAA